MSDSNSWTHNHQQLNKIFHFDTFEDAIAWMQDCSIDIVRLDHHPDRTNRYNIVNVTLTTHDAHHTVTDLDRQVAHLMDKHYQRYQSTDHPG